MGQTRVDLLHLLEDLRDAYPGDLEETILTEIVANSLDSGASRLSVFTDPAERTVVVADNGSGMARRELSRYHDIAASTKTRGEGIGFAGVGIKLGLLAAEEVLTETRKGDTHVATKLAPGLAQPRPLEVGRRRPTGWPQQGTAVGLRLKNPLSPLLDPGYIESALRRQLRAAVRPLVRRDPLRALPGRRDLRGQRPGRAEAARLGDRPGGGGGAPAPEAQACRPRLPRALTRAPRGGPARHRREHPGQGHPPRLGLDRSHLVVARPRGRSHRSAGAGRRAHPEQGRLRARGAAGDRVPRVSEGDPGSGGRASRSLGRGARQGRHGQAPSRSPAGARPRDGARGPGRGLPGSDRARGATRRGPAASAQRRRQRVAGGGSPGSRLGRRARQRRQRRQGSRIGGGGSICGADRA